MIKLHAWKVFVFVSIGVLYRTLARIARITLMVECYKGDSNLWSHGMSSVMSLGKRVSSTRLHYRLCMVTCFKVFEWNIVCAMSSTPTNPLIPIAHTLLETYSVSHAHGFPHYHLTGVPSAFSWDPKTCLGWRHPSPHREIQLPLRSTRRENVCERSQYIKCGDQFEGHVELYLQASSNPVFFLNTFLQLHISHITIMMINTTYNANILLKSQKSMRALATLSGPLEMLCYRLLKYMLP